MPEAGEPADLRGLAGRMASLLDPALSWSDVDALRRMWTGPLILKGILHPAEARAAVEHGVDGLIVSNHGGRQLDGAPASIAALPAVVDAVAARMPVLLDGGVRRGADIVKALALGASACLIGRPHLWGLAVAGEAGVAHVLEIYRREMDRVMGLCGISRIADIGRDLVFSRDRKEHPRMIEDPPLLTIRRGFARPPSATVAAFAGLPTGHAVDAMGGRGALDYRVKPLAPMTSVMVGVAMTCHCGPADNLALFAALAAARTGDILLAAADGYAATSIAGDLLDGHGAQSRLAGSRDRRRRARSRGHSRRRSAGFLRRRDAQFAGPQRPRHGRASGGRRRRSRSLRAISSSPTTTASS